MKLPIIRTPNFNDLKDFYINHLNFTLSEELKESLRKVTLEHKVFQLVLEEGPGGFTPTEAKAPLGKEIENAELVLYIPVPSATEYLNEVRNNGAHPLTEILLQTPYADHSFEGFYIRDPDNNPLCFFTDGHGPYIPKFWDWCWEPKLTNEILEKYQNITKRRVDLSLMAFLKKILNWFC